MILHWSALQISKWEFRILPNLQLLSPYFVLFISISDGVVIAARCYEKPACAFAQTPDVHLEPPR